MPPSPRLRKTYVYINTRRLLRSLSGNHYRTILLTVLLPGIAPPIFAYFSPDFFIPKIVLYVVAFLVWAFSSVLAVASMLERDRFEAEQQVAHRIEALSRDISKLSQEQGDFRVDLRQEIDNLEEAVRSTLNKELKVVLPPRGVSLRVKPIHVNFNVSAVEVTVGGNWIARLRQRFRRLKRQLKQVFYGNSED